MSDNIAIIIGRKKSKGFPNKNTYNVCGHPLCYYPMIAATKSNSVSECLVSTDDPKIAKIALDLKCSLINRPPELATDEALGEDVFIDAYNKVKDIINIKYCVLLFANAPMVLSDTIDAAIDILDNNSHFSSVCTVSKYNMFHPSRMRIIHQDFLYPYNELIAKKSNCDRNSSGDVYIYDCCCAVVRPKCLENIENGMPPQRWLGNITYPIINNYGIDVDYPWQIGQVEYWIKNYYKE